MGIIGLSKSVAMDQARHGVRCNTVIPGLMNTPLVGEPGCCASSAPMTRRR
jgi:NAD(P)-dependent dehydrogenase (short-subunit alcohol dehydrogenase family)